MTEIEQKALALLNEVNMERNRKGATFVFVDRSSCVLTEALCRAIEQHEAFKREVSDAVEEIAKVWGTADPAWGYLRRFIIAKPDHIRGAALDIGVSWGPNDSDSFRAALAARGLEIREKQ